VAQFGQMESLDGGAAASSSRRIIGCSINFVRTRRLVLVSPIPFEKPLASHAPDLTQRNGDVAAYASAVRDLASNGAVFVDFSPRTAQVWRAPDQTFISPGLACVMWRPSSWAWVRRKFPSMGPLREAIVEKNRLWFDSWRRPTGRSSMAIASRRFTQGIGPSRR
jgi:hypothetical protein